MALKALILRQKIDQAKKGLAALDFDALKKREEDLTAATMEAKTDEEFDAVSAEVEAYEADKAALEEKKAEFERTIADLEKELAEEEANQNTDPEPTPEPEKRKDEKPMNKRTILKMNAAETAAFVEREDVKSYLSEIRSCIREKRALTNVGLTIPEVFLGILKENILEYSKLYKHVNVRNIGGEGRLVVEGTIPEAVWTDCCANLNELTLVFNDVEVNCWKVAGFYAVCNAVLEDSDADLAAELVEALAQGIGLALDKAILYGTGTRMPLGVVTRLAQTQQPAGYPATARTWANLSVSNIQTIAATAVDEDLFKAIILATGAAKGAYSRGEKVFVMNETTYTYLMANAMTIDASGAIVAGARGAMPVTGGVIEVLNFVPDYNIVFGYFDLYLLAERAGSRFATSEHVRFLQDQTVFKGTARYDGQPAIAEAFGVIGVNGTTPATTITFAADTANT